MKTRYGFVSNSSSSSFIIGTKEPISKKYLRKILKADECVIPGIIEGFVNILIGSSSLDSYMKEYELDEEDSEKMNKIKEIYPHISVFDVSNEDEDYPISIYLYNNKYDLAIKTDDLIIQGF